MGSRALGRSRWLVWRRGATREREPAGSVRRRRASAGADAACTAGAPSPALITRATCTAGPPAACALGNDSAREGFGRPARRNPRRLFALHGRPATREPRNPMADPRADMAPPLGSLVGGRAQPARGASAHGPARTPALAVGGHVSPRAAGLSLRRAGGGAWRTRRRRAAVHQAARLTRLPQLARRRPGSVLAPSARSARGSGLGGCCTHTHACAAVAKRR
jgi:hypothetical protein